MQSARLAITCAGLLLCACANNPPVASDSRWPFDTARGMYGGNEFQSRSPEGKITYASEAKQAAAQPSPAPVAQPVLPVPASPAAVAPPVASAAAPAPPPAASATPRIVIDANAFAAVFPGAGGAVHPSAEQLLQLDSLSLVAAEPARTRLQEQILACRRAQDRCLLAAP